MYLSATNYSSKLIRFYKIISALCAQVTPTLEVTGLSGSLGEIAVTVYLPRKLLLLSAYTW